MRTTKLKQLNLNIYKNELKIILVYEEKRQEFEKFI